MLTINEVNKQGKGCSPIDSYVFNNLRTILLTGEVNDAMADQICLALMALDAVDSTRPITLLINSPGGSVTAGLAIFDCMHNIKAPVNTFARGIAASMAALLLAGGTGERLISANSRVLIHQVMSGASGQASDIQIACENIMRTKSRLNELLADCTGNSVKKVTRDTDRDHWMDAEEAVAYHICDRIV